MRSVPTPAKIVFVAIVICLISGLFFSTGLHAEGSNSPKSPIRITPPAPQIDDKERQAELTARRARVAEAIGPTGMLVLFSGEPRVYTNDVDYPFRAENNFYYLTNLKQVGATLVLLPGNVPVLFLPRRNPAAETWTGHMYSAEEAAERSAHVGWSGAVHRSVGIRPGRPSLTTNAVWCYAITDRLDAWLYAG